jgi:glycosyltransferase involved in cell wall biosynthesis
MRILMISEARTFHAQRWSAAMADRGHEVFLLSISQESIPGVTVVPMQTPGFGPAFIGRWHRRRRQYVAKIFKRLKPDLAHMHFLDAHPLTAELLDGVQLVVSTWGSDVMADSFDIEEAPEQRMIKTELLQLADCVTATTRHLADETARYGDLDPAAIEVIPFGVDLDRFQPKHATANPGPTRLLYLKHLFPFYGPDVLLRAMPTILSAEPNTRLSMVGTGPMRDSLPQLAESLGVADAIKWYGQLPHSRIPTLMAEHDIHVMPSLREAFGVSAVEAQAAGVPVICSDLPGVREAIEDGVGGLTVPPDDSNALAEVIIRLIRDDSLRWELGRQGRQFVCERFNWRNNVSAMDCVYSAVVSQKITHKDEVEALAGSGV